MMRRIITRSPSGAVLLLALAALIVAGAIPHTARAEVFLDLGGNSTHVEADIATMPAKVESTESGYHFGIGARRELRGGGNIGMRLEADDLDSTLLLSLRALDYRYSFSRRFALGAFLGAARLDLDTPAHGYYYGVGAQLKDLLPHWDLSLDLRFGDKLARDNVLPTDPQGGRPDDFYDLRGVSVYLSRRF